MASESDQTKAGWLDLAQVMAHCGGRPAQAAEFIANAIASAPEAPEPYGALAELWKEQHPDVVEFFQRPRSLETVAAKAYISFLENDLADASLALGAVTGMRPTVAWAKAPWFSDPRYLEAVSAAELAEGALQTTGYGEDLDDDETRERLEPWVRAVDTVAGRDPQPDAMAKMAIFLRACGLTDASLALCDRADAVERVLMIEVVRAGTLRTLGEADQAAAAFERALELDPSNWSLCLDAADLQAEKGDFASAVRLVAQGLEHETDAVTLRAARAAYGARLTGSSADLSELIELAPELEKESYRGFLITVACDGPDLPDELRAEALKVM
ncbi:MAG: tetratricopeptide repeat protein [Catenulispora sp.]|nr:tetratricopeptide repeat protein [Catenulispora sp.]